MASLISSNEMNAFSPFGVKVGDTTLCPNLNTIPAEIDSTEAGTCYAGDPMVIVSTSAGVVKVKRLTADGGKIIGFLRPNQLKQQGAYKAGDKIELCLEGCVMVMKASASISAGADVNSVVAGSGVHTVATAASAGSVVGVALDAAASGGAVKVLIKAPVAFSANS